MPDTNLLNRISVNPAICHGKPCIRGHRIPVAVVLDRLADGESVDDLALDYPGVSRDDILACVAYAALLARGTLFELQPGKTG
ncbi:MAG: DUF433 domain-containing protein [Planctomycetes bacterium]|nr:DUF433 domain-containing protein [Planctomycetota bacterium]